MKLNIHQIDAFADQLFAGNPASVVPLENWLPEPLMQSIAAENNQSETSFYVPEGSDYRIRWFTPKAEVKLCGHATLASAYVIFNENPELREICLKSASGPLKVTRDGELLSLDFPASPIRACETPAGLIDALGIEPSSCLTTKTDKYIAIFDSPEQVINANPDLSKLMELDADAVGISAPSSEYDFVSRLFAPKIGVPEDPVTGALHTGLVPYWSERLGKTKLHAKQVSARGGELFCELRDDRVIMSGKASQYLHGTIEIPDAT